MARASEYPPKLRERAVRMVMESRAAYPHEAAAIRSIAAKPGIASTESVPKWVQQAEIDGGVRAGRTSEELAEIKALKREHTELRRANGILKSASAFFAAKLVRLNRY